MMTIHYGACLLKVKRELLSQRNYTIPPAPTIADNGGLNVHGLQSITRIGIHKRQNLVESPIKNLF